MNLKEIYTEVQNLTTVKKEESLFFSVLVFSLFLWSLDAVSTNYLINTYGLYAEANDKAVLIYKAFSDNATVVFTVINFLLHTFVFFMRRMFPILGWFTLTFLLSVTFFTNTHNFFLSGFFFK